MLSHPVWLALAITLLFLFVRNHWLTYKIEDHLFRVGYFARRTGAPQKTVAELTHCWPSRFMLFEIWRWDWARYVIHQDHLFDMERFIDSDLVRSDLDWDAFNQVHPSLLQAGLNPDATAVIEPATTTAPTDPFIP